MAHVKSDVSVCLVSSQRHHHTAHDSSGQAIRDGDDWQAGSGGRVAPGGSWWAGKGIHSVVGGCCAGQGPLCAYGPECISLPRPKTSPPHDIGHAHETIGPADRSQLSLSAGHGAGSWENIAGMARVLHDAGFLVPLALTHACPMWGWLAAIPLDPARHQVRPGEIVCGMGVRGQNGGWVSTLQCLSSNTPILTTCQKVQYQGDRWRVWGY
jgi:hypothetical protein